MTATTTETSPITPITPTDRTGRRRYVARLALVAALLTTGLGACNGKTSPAIGPSGIQKPTPSVSPTAAPSDNSSAAPTSTDSVTPTDTSVASETSAGPTGPAMAFGRVFYSDDFATKVRGWPENDNATLREIYHTGNYVTPEYTVEVKGAGLEVTPHPEFRGVSQDQLKNYDVSAEIQTSLSVGDADFFGVTCRLRDRKSYTFEMALHMTGGDGTSPWVIEKHDNGRSTILGRGRFTIGGSAFTIGGACVTRTDGAAVLSMQVNGQAVGSAVDTSAPLTAGYGGVYLFSKDGHSAVNVLDFRVRPASLS